MIKCFDFEEGEEMSIINVHKKSFTRKKSVFKSWIISYFSLIMIFFVLFNVFVLFARNMLKKEVLESNDVAFRLIDSNLGNMKNEVDELAMQIMLNTDITDMLKETKLDNKYYLKINTIRNDTRKLMTSFEYAEKLVLYKHNSDVLFIDGGLLDAQKCFSSYIISEHIDPQKGFAEWKNFFSKKHNQEMYSTTTGDIIYIHSILVQNEILGTLIVVLNKEAIAENFQELKKDMGVNVIILNNFDEPIYALKNDMIKELAENNGIHIESGIQNVKVGKEDVIMFASELKSKIRCLYTVPSVAFYSSTNFLGVVVCILTAIFILIGFVLSFYYSKKNYMPVQNMLGLLEKYQYKKNEQHDEFALINESLNKLIEEGEENKIIKVKYNKNLFDSEIVKCLTGNFYTRSIEEVFEFYNIPFLYSSYISAVIIVDDADESICGDDIINNKKTGQELYEVVFCDALGGTLGKDYSVLAITLNNMYFCLIGTNILNKEKIKLDIRKCIADTNTLFEQEIGVKFYAYFSEVLEELNSLKKMYNQINATYMFNKFVDEKILFHDEIVFKEKQFHQGLTDTLLLEAVQKGDLKTIKDIVVQMIMYKDAIESPLQLAYIKYKILNVLSKSMQYPSNYNNGIYLLIDKVNRSNSVIELLSPLLEILDNLCDQKKKNSKRSAELIDNVIEYVNQNYSDCDVNVDKIGKVFSLAPSYLSNQFKLSRGEMLRDYIVKVRLQNAKKMLLLGCTVEEVALKSGFGSSNSFIRTFKRNFGITPNQYKTENIEG